MTPLNTTNVYVLWKNHLLLIQRSKFDDNLPSYWESPAGHVDVYCMPLDSYTTRTEALRELNEETGISASAQELTFLPKFSNKKHLSYLLTIPQNLPPKIKLSFEHDNFKWQDIHTNLLPRCIRPEVVHFIRSYRNA